MRKYLNKVWPWKRILELETELSKVNFEFARERQHHKITQDNYRVSLKKVEDLKAKEQLTESHVRKMAQIIAIRGGIIG